MHKAPTTAGSGDSEMYTTLPLANKEVASVTWTSNLQVSTVKLYSYTKDSYTKAHSPLEDVHLVIWYVIYMVVRLLNNHALEKRSNLKSSSSYFSTGELSLPYLLASFQFFKRMVASVTKVVGWIWKWIWVICRHLNLREAIVTPQRQPLNLICSKRRVSESETWHRSQQFVLLSTDKKNLKITDKGLRNFEASK